MGYIPFQVASLGSPEQNPVKRKPLNMRLNKGITTIALLLSGLAFSTQSTAEELLSAEVKDAGHFAIDADSRQDPEGGTISLGDDEWTISRVSVHGLIGASGEPDTQSNSLEHVVFSSSFP